MGFLRKIGRKIKKKLNKVFGEKLGSIVGFVGLYFTMGAVAKQLSGWAKSTFGKGAKAAEAATKASEVAATTADVAASGEKLASLKDFSTVTKGTQSTTGLNMANVEAAVMKGGSTVENLMSTASTTADSFNAWVGGHESLMTQGKLPINVSPSLTDAVTTNITNPNIFTQTSAEVKAALEIKAPVIESVKPKIDFTQGIQESAKAGMDLVKTAEEGATTFQKLAADPVGYTVEGIKSSTAEGVQYVKSGDFVPDMAQGALTASVSNVLNPPMEPEFQSAGVAGPIGMEQAQAAHMAEIRPMLDSSNLGNVRTFTDLANQTLYGTGTPSYMQGIYQPLPIPNLS